MTACHPIVAHTGGCYQAWCKPCGWHSETYDAVSWALAARDRHAGRESPAWARGPG